jgi:hypothetical protein
MIIRNAFDVACAVNHLAPKCMDEPTGSFSSLRAQDD